MPDAPAGLRLALAGGGTGGHVVPGRNLLRRLVRTHRRPSDLLWFGSGRPVERRVLDGIEGELDGLVPDLVTLALEPPSGGAPSLARVARRLLPAALAARRSLAAHRSEVLLGLGGFTSAPAVLAARWLGIPVALLEVNAAVGKATRFGAPLARRVLHAWRPTVPAGGDPKHVWIGPPLAPEHERGEPDAEEERASRRAFGLDPARPCLLVLGGSQGAAALNRFVVAHVDELLAAGAQVLHQVGPDRASEGAPPRPGYACVEFLDDVRAALAAATLVLSRGGASTLAEIAAARRPAWVVPFPHHPDRHQERNARLLGAGVRVIPEERLDASPDEVVGELVEQLGPAGESARRAMAQALRESIPLDGTERLALVLAELAGRPLPDPETRAGTPDVD